MINNKNNWPQESKYLSSQLHHSITIKSDEWHKHRSNNKRRAAEQLSAALVQLINNGESEEILIKIEQSILWLKSEVKDQGCSGH